MSRSATKRAAVGRPDEPIHEPHRITVSFVPAAEKGWTDVEVKRGDRVCIMAHVLSDRATDFADASVTALGGYR